MRHGIVASEMGDAGMWDEMPCVVVKDICDHAGSREKQDVAGLWRAATAAASRRLRCLRPLTSRHRQQLQLGTASHAASVSCCVGSLYRGLSMLSGRVHEAPWLGYSVLSLDYDKRLRRQRE